MSGFKSAIVPAVGSSMTLDGEHETESEQRCVCQRCESAVQSAAHMDSVDAIGDIVVDVGHELPEAAVTVVATAVASVMQVYNSGRSSFPRRPLMKPARSCSTSATSRP